MGCTHDQRKRNTCEGVKVQRVEQRVSSLEFAHALQHATFSLISTAHALKRIAFDNAERAACSFTSAARITSRNWSESEWSRGSV
eukprot:3550519-Pleurochrysis_carterae.AAC.2